jgi:hypothetical protein
MKLLHIINNKDSFIFSFNEGRLFKDIIPEFVFSIKKNDEKGLLIYISIWRLSFFFDIVLWRKFY